MKINSPRTKKLGELGEILVAQWLETEGWTILHHRWRCRWGEIDLIAQKPTTLLFVEVKTRSRGNWDANGLLAITASKQRKLWQTAELFLAENPNLANLNCQFDLALVKSKRQSPPLNSHLGDENLPRQIEFGQPLAYGGYLLTLDNYLPAILEQ
ncbi:MAG: YraN family protein [Oscillatoria sp. PMC 1068.18]|nr:YraN family protein [Oscillatoria sp. PMC 1076.18]MEC4989650.1 YraN family protein [Oscillatoria sp. PMC 1068.18]